MAQARTWNERGTLPRRGRGACAPDGRVASGLIFGRSPVDGRAVRADEYGLTFDRNTALHAAGYDDTARSFVFGGR